MKPIIHAESSAKKFGGHESDYLEIHDWFDQTKSHFSTNAHRAILHSSFGIFLCEQVFGHIITNSDGKQVSVRDIGEQHVIEDLKCIPTVSDYLMNLKYQSWMNGDGLPPSMQNTFPEKEKNHQFITFDERAIIDSGAGEAGGCPQIDRELEKWTKETYDKTYDGSRPFSIRDTLID